MMKTAVKQKPFAFYYKQQSEQYIFGNKQTNGKALCKV